VSGGLDRREGGNARVGGGSAGGAAGMPGKRTLTEGLQQRTTRDLAVATVQLAGGEHGPTQDSGAVQQAAAQGIAGAGGALPHGDTIQRLFGRHDVSGIEAHIGGPAETASRAIGAEAYASGDHVAFAGAPSLHTAAHEAAHVMQQRGGVQLKGGVGEAVDPHEQHADQVANAVVAGRSAAGLLDQHVGGSGSAIAGPVQRKPDAGGASSSPAPIAPATTAGAGQLAQLLAAPSQPGLGDDPVVAYLERLAMPALLDQLSEAIDCGYALRLESHLAAAPPQIGAALFAAELARLTTVTPAHPALQRAGAALDRVGRDQQLQILAWMLARRGVSVEATALVEGTLAMREGGAAANDQAGSDHAGGPAADGQNLDANIDASVSAVQQASGAPAPINPAPWAPPGDQPGGWYVGTAAHTAIAEFYRAAHPGDVPIFDNNTPISSILNAIEALQAHSKPTRAELIKDELARRPDIANIPRRHLYEIKPALAQAEAAAKARMYLSIFESAGVAMTLGPMGEPGTFGGLPAPAGVFMFQSPEPGVITYEYRRGRLVPVPVRAPEPARERRWRWELKPLTPQQKQVIVTTTVGGAILIILMIILAPVGA
jgi:hypothetical protein